MPKLNSLLSVPMNTHTASNSSFYSLLSGSERFELIFPCNSDEEGPFWNDDGSLIHYLDGSIQSTTVRLVELGAGRYRLAENPIFEVPTTLHWGDELNASPNETGELELLSVAAPQRFSHLSTISSPEVALGSSISNKIHELGGGWESVMGGILTITLPAEKWPDFSEWLSKTNDWRLL